MAATKYSYRLNKQTRWSPWSKRQVSEHVFWENTQRKKPMSFLEHQVHDDMMAEGYTNYEEYWVSKLE